MSYPKGVRCFRVIRFYEDGRKRTIKTNLTIDEAQAHCRAPSTRGIRNGIRFFDGFDYMRGMRPD